MGDKKVMCKYCLNQEEIELIHKKSLELLEGTGIVIEHPQKSPYGGVVAAPIFRAIAERSLLFLDVLPDQVTSSQ